MIYKVSFNWIKEMCKFREDEKNCKHDCNNSSGSPWGECNKENCPLLSFEKRILSDLK